jgi:hypothetical protein
MVLFLVSCSLFSYLLLLDVDSLPSKSLGVISVPNENFIYDFTDKNPNITAWGVVFQKFISPFEPGVTNYEYQLWFNFTESARKFRVKGAPSFVVGTREPFNDDVVAMMRGLDEAISKTIFLPNN